MKTTFSRVKEQKFKTEKNLTMFYLKSDILILADVFEKFLKKTVFDFGINPL